MTDRDKHLGARPGSPPAEPDNEERVEARREGRLRPEVDTSQRDARRRTRGVAAVDRERAAAQREMAAADRETIVSTPPPVAMRMRLIATDPKRGLTSGHWIGSQLAGMASLAHLIMGALKQRRTSGPQTDIEPSRIETMRPLTERRLLRIAVSPRRKPISGPRVAGKRPETANARPRTAKRPSQTELRLTTILSRRERT